MKKIILFLLIIPILSFGQGKIKEKQNKEIEIPTITKEQAKRLCKMYTFRRRQNKLNTVEVLRQEVLKILGKDPKLPTPTIYDKEVIAFLNKNLDKIVCKNSRQLKVRKYQSLFKYAIDIRDYDFVTTILYKGGCSRNPKTEKRTLINLNIYDVIDGKKETFIDFLDIIIEDPHNVGIYEIDDLKEMREILMECGAKRGAKL